MVTYEQLNEHNAARPFVPFWVRLRTGETIQVMNRNTAVISRKQLVYTPDRKRLRWIPLEEIDAYGRLAPAGGSSTGGNRR